MPKRMAFSKTIPQMRDYSKTLTTRDGWWCSRTNLPRVAPGEVVTAIEKGMGLRKGDRQVVIHDIEIVRVWREPNDHITQAGVVMEGFPGLSPEGFVAMFGGDPGRIVTRILFFHLGPKCASCNERVIRMHAAPQTSICGECCDCLTGDGTCQRCGAFGSEGGQR